MPKKLTDIVKKKPATTTVTLSKGYTPRSGETGAVKLQNKLATGEFIKDPYDNEDSHTAKSVKTFDRSKNRFGHNNVDYDKLDPEMQIGKPLAIPSKEEVEFDEGSNGIFRSPKLVKALLDRGPRKFTGKGKPPAPPKKEPERKKYTMWDEETIDEHIAKDAPCSDYIDDFVHSKNKKFSGDSKKQRIKRALGACNNKEEVEEALDVPYERAYHKKPTQVKPSKQTKPDAYRKMMQRTLKYPDAIAGVMGGPSKAQAKKWLQANQETDPRTEEIKPYTDNELKQAKDYFKGRATTDKELKQAQNYFKKKKVKKEETELDELTGVHNKKTLSSYIKKARTDLADKSDDLHMKSRQDWDGTKKTTKGWINRYRGIGKAADRLAKEEALDELKKSTLASYTKKASQDVAVQSMNAAYIRPKSMEVSDKQFKQSNRRLKGISKAVDRLTGTFDAKRTFKDGRSYKQTKEYSGK